MGIAAPEHGHGGLQPAADGGDGVQDQGDLRLLHPLCPAEPRPVRARVDRRRMAGSGPADLPLRAGGSGGHAPRLGLGYRRRPSR